MVRAWRHAASCASPATPVPWVRAIARREALRILGRQREEEPLESAPGVAVESASTDALDVRRAVREHLEARDRQLVVHRYWQGLTDREISDLLGLPIGTVKTRLHRARSKLERALEKD